MFHIDPVVYDAAWQYAFSNRNPVLAYYACDLIETLVHEPAHSFGARHGSGVSATGIDSVYLDRPLSAGGSGGTHLKWLKPGEPHSCVREYAPPPEP
jgi:hypothetical protein